MCTALPPISNVFLEISLDDPQENILHAYAFHLCPLLSQVILTPPEAPNQKSEELSLEPGFGRPLPPEVKVEGPREELEAVGAAGFGSETVKAEPEVSPSEGLQARLPAVLMENTAQVCGLSASANEIAQPQKGRKPRDLELPLSPSLLGGPGPERTPGSGTGSGLQAPGPALTPSLLPTHTLVSALQRNKGWQPGWVTLAQVTSVISCSEELIKQGRSEDFVAA